MSTNSFVEFRRSRRRKSFQARPLKKLAHANSSDQPLDRSDILDLVVIAFDTPWTIRYQIKLLRKYLIDPYAYTVCDNSRDEEAAFEIAALCREEEVGYIRLRSNPALDSSESHGLALNWAWRNYLKPRGASYFGFVDHDIFPIRRTRLIPDIDTGGVYGHQQERLGHWYLWPGFCFISRDLIRDEKLNFLPSDGFDTGGQLARSLYSHRDRSKIPRPAHSYERLRVGNDDPQADYVEYLGDWLHTINGSNWKGVEEKSELVVDRLAEITRF
jgi:hypothetical protein